MEKQVPNWIQILDKIIEEAQKQLEKEKKEAMLEFYKKSYKNSF